LVKTPLELGLHMPAEWEAHEGTWLQRPQDKLYRGYELKLEKIWFSMVEALHQHENVHLIIAEERQGDHILRTSTSIIDTFRNPGMSQADIEENLRQYLGVTHFIWLTGAGRGECDQWGDETDSHIDIVARFTNENTVLYNWTDDVNDPWHAM